jgi:hypothetical protein
MGIGAKVPQISVQELRSKVRERALEVSRGQFLTD